MKYGPDMEILLKNSVAKKNIGKLTSRDSYTILIWNKTHLL